MTKAVSTVKTKAVNKKQNGTLVTALDSETQKLYNICLALSKSSAVPMQYISKPDWIFSTVVLGKEFGLGPMSSLMNISTINGKPSMSVHLLLGLCMRHPQFAGWKVIESTRDGAQVKMWRKFSHQDKPIEFVGEFTRQEAVQAHLIKTGGAWEAWGRNMCKARAIAFVCREAFADVLTGTYTLEEMDSEKYVDSFMAEDMQAVDRQEESELTGKPIETEKREPVLVPKKTTKK